jgi:hypothetical protein
MTRSARSATRFLFLAALLWGAGGGVRANTGEQPATEEAPPTAISTEPIPHNGSEGPGLNTLGVRLTERGDYAAAEIAFRQVLDSTEFPPADQLDALIGIARMYRRQGT